MKGIKSSKFYVCYDAKLNQIFVGYTVDYLRAESALILENPELRVIVYENRDVIKNWPKACKNLDHVIVLEEWQ